MFREVGRTEKEKYSNQWQQELENLLMEHKERIDRIIESQKKARDLMLETIKFMAAQWGLDQDPEQSAYKRQKLVSYLITVQEDEFLKTNRELQKLVGDIYENMDDKEEMWKMTSRFSILENIPQISDILGSLKLMF